MNLQRNQSDSDRTRLVLLLGLIVFFGFLAYEVIAPFLSAIVWAVILAIITFPLYRFLLKYVKYERVASVLNLIILLLIILGPVAYFFYLLINEVSQLAGSLKEFQFGSEGGTHPEVRTFVRRLLSIFGFSNEQFITAISGYLTRASQKLASRISAHTGLLFTTIFEFFIMFIVLFFLPIHGSRLINEGIAQIPLRKTERERFRYLIKDVIISTIYGGLFSAVAHGVLAFAAFSLADVPAAVLLSLATAFTSLIPVIGSAVVWLGVVLYLILVNKVAAAVVIVLVALIGTQFIDHFMRPWLSKGRAKVPFIIVLLGILGGLEFFGFVGFVVGPVVLAIFIALIRMIGGIKTELSMKQKAGRSHPSDRSP